jgi:hypothetical protein
MTKDSSYLLTLYALVAVIVLMTAASALEL